MDALIENYMTEHPHSIRSGETLESARNMMKKFHIRHLPVVQQKKIIGLITERDFSLINLYPDMNLKTTHVDELMLQYVYQPLMGTPLKEVLRTMTEEKLGSAIIVDAEGDIKGIFTAIDALTLLYKIYDR